MRTFKAVLAGLLFVVLGACADDPEGRLSPGTLDHLISEAAGAEGVPPRNEGDVPWLEMSDAELWAYIAERDSSVIVGLKAPGVQRGVWQDRILISAPRQAEGRQAISAIRGVEVIHVDTLRPIVELKLPNRQSLTRLRQLPFTDYVEPGVMELSFHSKCSWSTISQAGRPRTPSGDILTPNYATTVVGLPMAWNRAQGSGVTVGVTDTGVSPSQEHLHARFTGGQSGSQRWYHHTHTWSGTWHDDCGHGTKVAGVIAAPMNGSNAVGVAWRSNLVTVRFVDKPTNYFTARRVREAIYEAATYRPPSRGGRQTGTARQRIVNMSWGSNPYESIKDEIRHWYARERLFVGAAGQGVGGAVVFPARMSEVIAVSAVNRDFSRRFNYSYGSQVELAFFMQNNNKQLAPGRRTNELSEVGGSSSPAAVVSGIAALVWSQYPTWSRDQVRARLRHSGHASRRNNTYGYGVPNAVHAVGGVYRVTVSGSPDVATPNTNYTLTANTLGGSGPFTYSWSTGQSGRSITWRAPSQPGFYNVSVNVTESGGTRLSGGTLINVGGDPNCPTCLQPSPGG